MSPQLPLGQLVATPDGMDVIAGMEAGHADTDIVRYRTANTGCWWYLDELIIISDPIGVDQ